MIVSCSMPGHDRDLLAVARDGGRAALGRAGREDLALRLAADLEAIPRLLGDFDPGLRQTRVAAEQAVAERQPEALDLGAGMLPGGGMHQALQRLARQQARRSPVDEGVGEIAFEAAGDGQVAGVVAIAAAHDPEHAQVRLAVAAGTDSEHGRHNNTGLATATVVLGRASRIMSD